MPTCIKVLPLGTRLGDDAAAGAEINGTHAFIVADSACSTDLRIYTAQEIAALTSVGPGSGSGSGSPSVPDAALMRETFFLSFGLVVGVWFVGKCVGAVLRLIKGEDREFV